MKFIRMSSPAALFLFLGTSAQIYAQHEQEGQQGKPERSQAKPAPQQRQEPQQRPQAQQPQQQQSRQQQPERAQQPKQGGQPREQQAQRAEQPKPAAQPREQQPERAPQPKPAAQPREQQAQRAQQPREQAQPQQRQQRQQAQPAQPAQRQQTAQGRPDGGRNTNYTPPLRTRQQAQTWQKQSSWHGDGAWQQHASWQQDRSSNWQSDHRTWAQRGGYGGYYIPQASFSLNFGVGHWFRIQNQPLIVGGYPQFQYGGYSFMMVDPWPADWAQDWYSADDVYVGYDNGYYLYNRQYPGEAIAITVVL